MLYLYFLSFWVLCLLMSTLGVDPAIPNFKEQQTGRPVQSSGPNAPGSYNHPDGLDQGGAGCCGGCVVA